MPCISVPVDTGAVPPFHREHLRAWRFFEPSIVVGSGSTIIDPYQKQTARDVTPVTASV